MTIETRLAEIRARADAATEGPWLHGDRWHVQGESHCACRPGYGPLIARRWMDINGKYMWAHVHESPEPFHPYGILARIDGEPLSVVVETVEYGTMSAEDAEFIAASRTDLPALLAAVEAVLGLHKPERRYLPYEGAGVSYDTPEEAAADMEYDDGGVLNDLRHFDLCAHCKVIEDSPCDGECTREAGYLASLWPCPTVRDLTAALEAQG